MLINPNLTKVLNSILSKSHHIFKLKIDDKRLFWHFHLFILHKHFFIFLLVLVMLKISFILPLKVSI